MGEFAVIFGCTALGAAIFVVARGLFRLAVALFRSPRLGAADREDAFVFGIIRSPRWADAAIAVYMRKLDGLR